MSDYYATKPKPSADASNTNNSTNNMMIMMTEGQLRFQSDKRQLGGLLMLLGATALVFPMASVATLVGPDGTTANEGIALTSLIAGVCVIAMGVVSVPLGYLQAVHDYSSPTATTALIVFTQLAWMPFLTDLTNVGQQARTGDAFIPAAYEPTEANVKFVGAMGMMGVLGYGTGFLGSLALIEFALLAFQKNMPTSRTGAYYRGRMTMYTFCNFLVGSSQLMLGIYCLSTFGSGPYSDGPISVAMYIVHFPEISIAVGCVQTLNAIYGLLRSFGIMAGGGDEWYQMTTLVQWIVTVVLQILTQVAYAPGGMAAPAAPSQTMLTLGLSAMCAFLDYKGRTTPDDLSNRYYGLLLLDEEDGDEDGGGGGGDDTAFLEDTEQQHSGPRSRKQELAGAPSNSDFSEDAEQEA